MKNIALTLLTLASSVFFAPAARADVKDRLYDFTDTYYRQNGVDPTKIDGRRQADGVLAVVDTPNFSFQRNVRALLTLPAYDHSGNMTFFTVLGELSALSFTNDAAGRNARQVADDSPEFVFPRLGGDPLGIGNGRQTFMQDFRHSYFSRNPLGLWLHVFVNYTDRALKTAYGHKELAKLAQRNGLAVDGTPLIKTLGEIDDFYKKGLVTKLTRGLNVSGRYAICPSIKDPTDGGIATDQFLAYTRKPDGQPLEPQFLANFLSLQQTGRWK